MASIPEQFSEARKWQFETQLKLFRALTTQVFESTERVIALNIDTSRAAVERSSTAVKQLLSINDPRDLFTLGSHGQEQLEQMLAYGRELFSIAAGAQSRLVRQAGGAASSPVAAQPAPAPAALQKVQPAPEPAPAVVETASVAEPASEPVAVTNDQAATEPAAKARAIAKAATKPAPKAAAVPHPLSSPVVDAAAQVELPMIKPVEASPPPAPVSGTPEIEAKRAERANLKGGRKK
jgi:phasin family protein